jgi:hypothetical protein
MNEWMNKGWTTIIWLLHLDFQWSIVLDKHCLKTGIIAEANVIIARQRLRKHIPTRNNGEYIAISIHAETGC